MNAIARLHAALVVAVLLTVAPASGASAAAPKLPDLTVSDLKFTSANILGPIDAHFTVKNQGQADAQGILVWVLVLNDKYTAQIDKLAAGKSKQLVVTIQPHEVRGLKTVVTVTVQVDPNNTIAESNEGNNEVTAPMVDLTKAPDLVVEKVDIQQTRTTPVEAKVTVRVKNQGKSDAQGFDLKLWEAADPGHPLDFFLGSGLAVGSTYDFDFVTQPLKVDPAKYVAEVDPTNQVLEANENNNRGSGEKTLKIDAKLPDLVLQVTKVELTNNHTGLTVAYSVRNGGGSDVSVPIAITLRQQNNLLQGDATIPGGLKKGESNDRTAGFSLPQDPTTVYGTHLLVSVDPQNLVVESNKGNNVVDVIIPDPRPKVNTGAGLLPKGPVQALP
jgi:subtilase family serine protease